MSDSLPANIQAQLDERCACTSKTLIECNCLPDSLQPTFTDWDAPDDNRGGYWNWDEPEYPYTPLACLIGHEALFEGALSDPTPGYAYSGADNRGLPTHLQAFDEEGEIWELKRVSDGEEKP